MAQPQAGSGRTRPKREWMLSERHRGLAQDALLLELIYASSSPFCHLISQVVLLYPASHKPVRFEEPGVEQGRQILETGIRTCLQNACRTGERKPAHTVQTAAENEYGKRWVTKHQGRGQSFSGLSILSFLQPSPTPRRVRLRAGITASSSGWGKSRLANQQLAKLLRHPQGQPWIYTAFREFTLLWGHSHC